MIRSIAGSIARPLAVAITGASGGVAPAPVDAYAANSFSPDYVADFSAASADYFRVAGATSDFETAFTSDSEGGGLATQVDSSGNLVWRAHNYVTHSSSFGTPWTLVGATLSGSTITATAGSGAHQIYLESLAYPANTQLTAKIRITRNNHDFVGLNITGIASHFVAVIADLSTGQITQTEVGNTSGTIVSSSVVDNGDDSYTISVTGLVADATNARVAVQVAGAATGNSYLAGGAINWVAAGTEAVDLEAAWLYRSDLGGMANNPDTGDSYVETSGAARYLARRRHHRWDGSAWVPTCLHEPVGATNGVEVSTPNSTDWSHSGTNGVTITANAAAGIDGNTSASTVVEDSNNRIHGASDECTLSTGVTCIWAIVRKGSGSRFLQLRPGGIGIGKAYANFDLSGAGSVTASGGTEFSAAGIYKWDADNYLAWLTGDYATAPADMRVLLADSGSMVENASYTGDGSSSLIVSHTQAENSALPSSPIITNGSTVTRTADTLKGKAASLPDSESAYSAAFAGRVNYADSGTTNEMLLMARTASSTNNMQFQLATNSTNTGLFRFYAEDSNQSAFGNAPSQLSPGVGVAYNVAGRLIPGSAQGALGGTAGSVATNGSQVALPDLSGIDARFGLAAGGSHEFDTIRLWDEDIAEAGIEEASAPTPILDSVSSAVLAFSVARKLRTDYTGSAIRVRRSSDDAEQDIGFDAVGFLDESALTTFCGAGDGFVVTVYEQSGATAAVDLTQATAANQMQIVSSGSVLKKGGKPYMQRVDTGDFLEASASWATRPSEAYQCVVAQQTATVTFITSGSSNAGRYGFIGQDGNATTQSAQAPAALYVDGALIDVNANLDRNDVHDAVALGTPVLVRDHDMNFAAITAYEDYRTAYTSPGAFPAFVNEAERIIITDSAQVAALEADQAAFYGITI